MRHRIIGQLRKILLPVFCASLLCLPASALGGGTLWTVHEAPSEAEQLRVISDYTGEVTITFLGDCTLGGEEKSRDFARRIEDNGIAYPFRNLIRLTGTDDLTVANLEGVLSDRNLVKTEKTYNFRGPASYTEILRAGSVECVTLANNHSHDYGEPGYRDTKAALEDAGVCWFGLDAPAIWETEDGVRIGFLGVGSSLTTGRYTTYKTYAQRLRDYGCAAVITVMHAGTEYDYNPPDAYQQQITTRAIPYTDLIIGHHPHVPQGYTVLDGVPVVYSLGNCVFGGNPRPKERDALVIQAVLHFTDGELDRIDLHFWPILISGEVSRNDYSPVFLSGEEAERVLEKIRKSTGMDPGPFDENQGAVVSFPAGAAKE